ncbi:MAG: ADP-forming succinate--CoA ligase subunit beta [Verrucomicrobia bacterium]|nr:ADP-forming succinate--CoA ligase subunit beta [Verrucomicrobiota bacterium]MCH8529085.1 ADP-forming succinate--CoA ligase subunit beta [Kiritimatiellia bacterium]
MNIHEYQAKALFRDAGISVPEGRLAVSVDEAVSAFKELNAPIVAVKAQVHVGGRGKAGGVKLARSADEVKAAAEAILGMDIKGHTVHRLWIEKGSDIQREAYVSVILDRSAKSVGFIASAEGGMDIEEVAESTPEKILLFGVNDYSFPEADARKAAEQLFDGKGVDAIVEVLRKLHGLFLDKDLSLVEINPLVLTGSGDVVALDGKVNIDDNALMRQPELLELRDMNEESEAEIEANKKGLAFIQLDGDIGCMVNGAGLAMATMDMINLFGGKPANFLDVGGSSNPEKVVHAFKYILAPGNIKAVLINIFGGITRCDDIARGILKAFDTMDISVPVVVRLTGTNAEEGKALLEGSKLIPATSFAEAVKKTIALGKGEAA